MPRSKLSVVVANAVTALSRFGAVIPDGIGMEKLQLARKCIFLMFDDIGRYHIPPNYKDSRFYIDRSKGRDWTAVQKPVFSPLEHKYMNKTIKIIFF